MRAVYPRAARRCGSATAIAVATATVALLALACGGGETSTPPAAAAERPEAYPLATLMASRSWAVLEADEASRRVVARASDGGTFVFDLSAEKPVRRPGTPPAPSATLPNAANAARLPADFRLAAISADGRRQALRRPLHPEADEVYLHDPGEGTRLLLPTAGDARFLPLAFADDGAALLFLTDEGSARLHLEWLDLESGARRPQPDLVAVRTSQCEVLTARISRFAGALELVESCVGAQRARRLEPGTGAAIDLPPLPAGTRAVDWLGFAEHGGGVATVASARLPRDLVWYPDESGASVPLTWGLAPGVDPARLSAPVLEGDPDAMGALPLEVWPAARRGPGAAAGVVWVEDDSGAPRWDELDPFFQFLAGRGIAVARLRLRGAEGFGRTFRHAADGRPLAAALEDLASARAALVRRGVEDGRIALVGEGGWPGAIAAMLARGAVPRSAGAPPAPTFSAIVSLEADPDPLARLDTLATLAEPAKSWWTQRLGSPGDAALVAAREATRAANLAAVVPLVPYLEGRRRPVDSAALWSVLARALAP